MGYIKWGGKKWYAPKPKPYKADINELMKPLSEKTRPGNVWGSVIMKVPTTTTPPPVETFYLTTEATEPLLTEGGDNILYD